MWSLRGLVVLGLSVSMMGCGESANDGGATGVGGASGSGTGGAAVGGSGAGGGSGGASGGGSGGERVNDDPILCGGAYAYECAEGKICRFDSGCGTVGHCTRITDSCDDNLDPVCGCDGKTYSNECRARAAGVSEGTPGECGATFECGPYHCGPDQYCLDKADEAKGPWRFACVDLPEACGGEPSCDCLSEAKGCYVRFACEPVDGGVMLTCE